MQFSAYSIMVPPVARGCGLLAVGCALLAGLAGCGPGGSGNSPTLEARASAAKAATTSPSTQENGAGSASGKETVPAGDKSLSKSAGTANNTETAEDKKIKAVEEKKSAALPVPDAITRDFESPYPRIRLLALDYWATQGTKAPLDPLLEALEDDDDEVRTKAAKIAEEKWGIKQELD